ncbi:MAG: Rid family hydrolase [Deinococcales bacterium]
MVKVNVYLTDVNYFVAMNEVYRQYFSSPPPARTSWYASSPFEPS